MIIIPAVLMGKVYKTQGQLGHVSREVETTGKKNFKEGERNGRNIKHGNRNEESL